MIEDIGDIAVLMGQVYPRVEGSSLRGRVVVNIVARLAHAGGRGHDRDGLIVAQLAAALSALQNGHEAPTVLFVEEGVEYRIDAGVAGAQPLGYRGGHPEHLVLPLGGVAAQLDPRKNNVERQP